MYTVLARKYRSQTFDDVVGQEAIAQTLKNAIKTGRIHHAYLFTGTRGVGKTTMARIFAKALNCHNADGPTPEPCLKCDSCVSVNTGEDVDVIEIDGASNNGVENIRELRENVIYRPARSRYKIYIIDEVHMVTVNAFNALLKTLEEPPSHVKFIFATTEPNKVLATIQSRCQRFDFVNISAADIAKQLKLILQKENIRCDEDVTLAIARAADGSMRDALSLLDQLLSTGVDPITMQAFEQYLGQPDRIKIATLAEKIGDSDAGGMLEHLNQLLMSGLTAGQVVISMIELMRDLMVIKSAGPQSGIVILTSAEREKIVPLADKFDIAGLIYSITTLEKLRWTIKNSDTPRALLEAALVRLALSEHFVNVGDLLSGAAGSSSPVKKNLIASPAPRAQAVASQTPAENQHASMTVSSLNELKENWNSFLDEVGIENSSLSGYLKNAVLNVTNDNEISLVFADVFIKNMCEQPPKCQQISSIFSQKLHKNSLKILFELAKGDVSALRTRPPGAKTSKQEREEVMNDPAVKAIITGLNATITGIEQ
jgi:DNA polymerase-3 subunit gamma/tau